MSWKAIVAAGEEPMRKTIDKMKTDFSALRTGRASTALLEGIKVDSYGTTMLLNQLASLSVPDSRTIEVHPWDISQISSIEKGILRSDVGLTPVNDGRVIRLSVPPLTEERRKDIIKSIHKMTEEYKVSVRNERRQILENIKKAEKDKQITEDDRKKAEVDLQKITDTYIKKIDELLAVKEKDIMEV
jgi:ribosome recycling factor